VWDREFTVVYEIASAATQVARDLATITGQREVDLLTLPNRDPDIYTDEGIVSGRQRRSVAIRAMAR
jgi:hypothetical protein